MTCLEIDRSYGLSPPTLDLKVLAIFCSREHLVSYLDATTNNQSTPVRGATLSLFRTLGNVQANACSLQAFLQGSHLCGLVKVPDKGRGDLLMVFGQLLRGLKPRDDKKAKGYDGQEQAHVRDALVMNTAPLLPLRIHLGAPFLIACLEVYKDTVSTVI